MKTFIQALDRTRRWQRLGRAGVAIWTTFAALLLLALLLGMADFMFGFESASRTVLVAMTWALVGVVLLTGLVWALRLPRRRAAMNADEICMSSRRIHSASLSLSQSEPQDELSDYLGQRMMDEAAQELSSVPSRKLLPWGPLGRAALVCALCLLAVFIVSMAHPRAFGIVLERLQNPSADLPPYSPLIFAVQPQNLECVYGGELTVNVTISGASLDGANGVDSELKHPVECLIRHQATGEVSRLPAFRKSAREFSRTLEGVTEPIELAFVCGRARSGWHSVAILLQPKVLGGMVTITPPAYTGDDPIEMPLDRNEIKVLEGSEIALELTSNRPLSDSTLLFTPVPVQGREQEALPVEGRVHDVHHIVFRWRVTGSGRINVTLRDVRATPAADDFEIALRAAPDQAPAVELESPPPLLYATPNITVPLSGRAEDDHALSQVQLIRTLAGFRDRSQVLASALQRDQYELSGQLDLEEIGAGPGQVIELYLEASDHNPSLLGQGASELSRIVIITEEEYAAHVRARTTLREFNERFEMIHRARDEAMQALEELIEAEGDEAIEEAAKKAAEAHRKAEEMLRKLAEDFPAFEAEKQLQDLARKHADKLDANLEDLKEIDPKGDADDIARAVERMMERLGAPDPDLEQLERDAKLMAQAGALLEMAARFQRIYRNQKSLVERFHSLTKDLAMGKEGNRRLLPHLAETQRKNRRALDEFTEELKKRADAIEHPELEQLKQGALDFHERLLLADIGSVMDLAAESGDRGRANDALTNAMLALEMLENLMKEPDPFCQACNGNQLKFEIPMPGVEQTLKEMLEALMRQNQGMGGMGMGMGLGMGMGGGMGGNEGQGLIDPNAPMLGPQRMRLQASLAAGMGRGEGGRGTDATTEQAAETASLNPNDRKHGGDATPGQQNLPEAYREAVKTYFLPESN